MVTVLFADLVGFTTLSETLDPEQVKRIVDRAFERLVRDLTTFGGRIDKIIGDAIVALFGAPTAHEDDAERAVRAALRMHETLATYAREAQVDIRMRVGVNTGEVLVGALRAGGDYTAMGDVVNIASRLQASADPGTVVVGPATHRATRDVIVYEAKGAVFARGREQPIEVFVAHEALLPPGARPRRTKTPLIGRDSELAVLEHTLDVSVRNGRAQQLLLLGEAGVGKTRLASEVIPLVRRHWPDAIVLSGRCVPYGEANPWWPIADAVRNGCGIDIDEPIDQARNKVELVVGYSLADDAETTAVVNGLLHLMGYEGPLRGLDPVRALAEATRSLITFMESSVRDRPIIVRLADLHWADDVVLDLIDNLSDQLARHPFVLVATARRSLLRRWSPRIGRFNSLVLNVDALDREAAEMLLDVLLESDVAPALRHELLDRSGGNPFYLEELVTLLAEGGVTADGIDNLPDTLRGLAAARIDGLTPDEQLTIEDASVWGGSGPVMAIERLAEATRGATSVAPVIASLATKEILTLDGDDWAFKSDLVREVAYTRLTKADRLKRHLGIAVYLEAAVSGRFLDDSFVDTVARHFTEAARLVRELGGDSEHVPDDLDERALAWIGDAARRAEQSAAWPLAERLFTQGLDLADSDELVGSRLGMLLGRSEALAEQWRLGPARDDARSALRLAEELGDETARARALMRLGGIESRDGTLPEARRLLDEVVAIFDGLGDRHGRAEALRLGGMAALLNHDTAAAKEPSEAALEDFGAVGDRRGEAWALQNLAWIAFGDGRVAEAQLRLDESVRAFTEIGDSGGLAWAHGLLAFIRFFEGRFDEARDTASRIRTETQRRGDRWGEGMMSVLLGAIDLWEGRTDDAVTTARRAVALFDELSDTVGAEQALALGGRALVMSGEINDGLEMLRRASETGPPGDRGGGAVGLGAIARAAAIVQLGDDANWAEVEDLLEVGRSLAEDNVGQVDLVVTSALWLAQRGDLADASKVLDGLVLGPDAVESGYACATRALVEAAEGHRSVVADLVERVAKLDTSTYLDRTLVAAAGVLVGLSELAITAETELAGTHDHLARAILALAVATVSGQHELSDDRWERLGVDPVGWRALFSATVRANA